MNKTHCPGCGAPFQTDRPGEAGFLPAEALAREDPICRRCYKLKHYGRLESSGRGIRRIHAEIGRVGRDVDLAVLVVDLFDLEGSLPREWESILPGPVVLALNKTDLLPVKTPAQEAVEAAGRLCRERLPGLNVREIIAVSARTRSGLLQLRERIIFRRGRRHRIGFFGVTNSGKSSLLADFLADGRDAPIVSNRPGTTQGSISRYLPEWDLTLIDTPGLSPGTRLTDKLCPDCSGNLVITSAVPSKYLELAPGAVVMLGAFAALENVGEGPAAIAVYAPKGINIHLTNPAKAEGLLSAPPAWLAAPCPSCRGALPLRSETLTAPAETDLFISGLGWFGLRKQAARLTLKVPEGVETGLRRPTLFGGKN